jgi:hypothetical protein
LHARTAEEDLMEAIAPYGVIAKASVCRDPHSSMV